MTVIEFAEKRLNEHGNEEYEVLYWAAYLDGARAQEKEDRLLIDELLAELGREHPEKRLAYERRIK